MAKNGVSANINGFKFKTFYYSVSDLQKALMDDFVILEIQGLASISPPPYMEKISDYFPNIYKMLTNVDEKFSSVFPFNSWADHFILTAELKQYKNN